MWIDSTDTQTNWFSIAAEHWHRCFLFSYFWFTKYISSHIWNQECQAESLYCIKTHRHSTRGRMGSVEGLWNPSSGNVKSHGVATYGVSLIDGIRYEEKIFGQWSSWHVFSVFEWRSTLSLLLWCRLHKDSFRSSCMLIANPFGSRYREKEYESEVSQLSCFLLHVKRVFVFYSCNTMIASKDVTLYAFVWSNKREQSEVSSSLLLNHWIFACAMIVK